MNEKTIKRNLQTCVILLVLSLLVAVASFLLKWYEIAFLMCILSALQAFLAIVWLRRKKNLKPHFKGKSRNAE